MTRLSVEELESQVVMTEDAISKFADLPVAAIKILHVISDRLQTAFRNPNEFVEFNSKLGFAVVNDRLFEIMHVNTYPQEGWTCREVIDRDTYVPIGNVRADAQSVLWMLKNVWLKEAADVATPQD